MESPEPDSNQTGVQFRLGINDLDEDSISTFQNNQTVINRDLTESPRGTDSMFDQRKSPEYRLNKATFKQEKKLSSTFQTPQKIKNLKPIKTTSLVPALKLKITPRTSIKGSTAAAKLTTLGGGAAAAFEDRTWMKQKALIHKVNMASYAETIR